MSRELHTANTWINQGHSTVLAVVAKTWGSAPRRAGSMMVIRGDETFEGSVSGGCVEGTVIAEALSMLGSASPQPKTCIFSVASEDAWAVGLACGGDIEIRLYPLGAYEDAVSRASKAIKARQNGLLKFHTDDGAVTFEHTDSAAGKHSPYDDEDHFVVPLIPHMRLDIVGAVHIAQHLSVMAHECDIDVRIIDPRSTFSQNRQFGHAEIISVWPDDFFKDNPADRSTAVVTLTHDPKLDDAALHEVLKSDAFYVGCLGSRKTHASRLERLENDGYSKADIARIKGPVGLDIGAATPAEIAASILSEIIRTARK